MVQKVPLETQARFSIGEADEVRFVDVAKKEASDGQEVFIAAPSLQKGGQVDLSDVGRMIVDSAPGRHTILHAELPQNTPENRQAHSRVLAMLALTAFADHFTSVKEASRIRIIVAPGAVEEVGEDELRNLKMRRVSRSGELKHFSANAMRLHAYGATLLRKADARLLLLSKHDVT